MIKKIIATAVIPPTLISLCIVSIAWGLTAQQIAKKTFPSIVLLVMEDANGEPISMGSGFFVRPNIVATNLHVIKGARSGYAKLIRQKKKYNIAGIVGIDEEADLILLSIDAVRGRPLSIGKSVKVQVGDTIYAVGNPLGFEGTFSTGIISGVRRAGKGVLFQITAPISPGSSGGPILDTQGTVVGISVATIKGGQNLNFAIPVNFLSSLLSKTIPVDSHYFEPEVTPLSIPKKTIIAKPQLKPKYSPPPYKAQEIGRDGVYIAYDNGIVRDANTGLEWKVGPDKSTTWDEARSWVQSLNLDGGGWRMPTMDELEGLYKKGAGKRNMTFLLKTTGWVVWSGETKGSSYAWTFIFDDDGRRGWRYRDDTRYGFRAFAVHSRLAKKTPPKPLPPILPKEKEPQKGRLFINLEPGYAEIDILDFFVNGYFTEAPRFSQGIVLEPGIHHLWVTAKGYKAKLITFKTNPLQDTKISIVLEPIQ